MANFGDFKTTPTFGNLWEYSSDDSSSDHCWWFRWIEGEYTIVRDPRNIHLFGILVLKGQYRELCSCGESAEDAYSSALIGEPSLGDCLSLPSSTFAGTFCSIEQKRKGLCVEAWWLPTPCTCDDWPPGATHPITLRRGFTGSVTDAANVQINVDLAFNDYINSQEYSKICVNECE